MSKKVRGTHAHKQGTRPSPVHESAEEAPLPVLVDIDNDVSVRSTSSRNSSQTPPSVSEGLDKLEDSVSCLVNTMHRLIAQRELRQLEQEQRNEAIAAIHRLRLTETYLEPGSMVALIGLFIKDRDAARTYMVLQDKIRRAWIEDKVADLCRVTDKDV